MLTTLLKLLSLDLLLRAATHGVRSIWRGHAFILGPLKLLLLPVLLLAFWGLAHPHAAMVGILAFVARHAAFLFTIVLLFCIPAIVRSIRRADQTLPPPPPDPGVPPPPATSTQSLREFWARRGGRFIS
jgi:hypothetical protein